MAKMNALAPESQNALIWSGWPTWRGIPTHGEIHNNSKAGDTGLFFKNTPQSTGRYTDLDMLKEINLFNPGVSNGFRQEGFYSSRNPNSIWVSPENAYSTTDAVSHEYQHLLNQARKKDSSFFDPYANNPEKRKAVEQLLSEVEGKYGPGGYGDDGNGKSDIKYNLSADFLDLNEGFLATLKGIEARLPVGKSIYDTNLGKAIFTNNPELKNYYMTNTRPTKGTYISAPTYGNDVPETKGPSIMQNIQNKLRDYIGSGK